MQGPAHPRYPGPRCRRYGLDVFCRDDYHDDVGECVKARRYFSEGAVRIHLLRHGPFGILRGTHHAVYLRGAREVAASDLFLAVFDRALVKRVPVVACPRLDVRQVDRLC